jgi:hypothetical protein
MVAQVNQGNGYRDTMHSPCHPTSPTFRASPPCVPARSCNSAMHRCNASTFGQGRAPRGSALEPVSPACNPDAATSARFLPAARARAAPCKLHARLDVQSPCRPGHASPVPLAWHDSCPLVWHGSCYPRGAPRRGKQGLESPPSNSAHILPASTKLTQRVKFPKVGGFPGNSEAGGSGTWVSLA